jgi:tRNA (guanine-N7-)-methyltransferase
MTNNNKNENKTMTTPPNHFRIRSFVRRDGRRTPSQAKAWETNWPQMGLEVDKGILNLNEAFKRNAPTHLEIGFGSGQSLLACAKAFPEKNFIGVETHKPGIGALLLGIEADQLTNIRVYYADVIDVLEKCIPNASLTTIQIFFPDPWQKRRHHQRRLIQPDFIKLILTKLIPNGELHLATDWEDYAMHMREVVSNEVALTNLAGERQFAERSPYRPVITKFERRAEREGRAIHELRLRLKPQKV